MSAKDSVSGSVAYEPCIVSFIDVLGFRSIIEKRSPGEIIKILSILKMYTAPEDEPQPRSMDEVRMYSRAFTVSVSDAVVRARCYNTQERDGAFFRELLDLLHAQVACVNNGVLIRAGLAVGNAHIGLLGDGPVFGPAMVRAYEIESNEAIFPRIVVDEDAYSAFLNDEMLRSDHNSLAEERLYVDRLLRVGEDGTRFIDYLGASFSEMDSPAAYADFVSNHANLIRKGLAANTNIRVRRKFIWLANYHNDVVTNVLEGYRRNPDARNEFFAECEEDPVKFYNSLIINT